MTEAESAPYDEEWEAYEGSRNVDPDWYTSGPFGFLAMHPHLRAGVTERKCRMFATACCRRVWRFIPEGEPRRVIEALERVEDGASHEWEIARRFYESPAGATRAIKHALAAVAACCWESHTELASFVAEHCSSAVKVSGEGRGAWGAEGRAQDELFRDIFGHLFRPVAFNPSWRTDTAVPLARLMGGAREFSAMPILADALQDAGCDSEDILSHCRDTNRAHVRGCWVVDLVLGQE